MNKRIGILGLGYVGLPLALEFSKKYQVTGFDIDHARVDALKKVLIRPVNIQPKNCS